MHSGKKYRKRCVTITVERILERDIEEIETLYIKKVINNTKSWDAVLRFVKNNEEVQKVCKLYPDAYIKIQKVKYTQEEIFG